MTKKTPEGSPGEEGDKSTSVDAMMYHAEPRRAQCAWLGMVIVCAAYNLEKLDRSPEQIACTKPNCDAIISTMPREGSPHLLEPAVDSGDPHCDTGGKHKLPRARPPQVEEDKPPKEKPRSAAPAAAPTRPPAPPEKPPGETPAGTGPWVNPFPEKPRAVPDTTVDQTISNS